MTTSALKFARTGAAAITATTAAAPLQPRARSAQTRARSAPLLATRYSLLATILAASFTLLASVTAFAQNEATPIQTTSDGPQKQWTITTQSSAYRKFVK